MKTSFYKIIGKKGKGCKIFFTDRRMDEFRPQVYGIFSIMDIVDGSYSPKLEDFATGRYQEIIDNIKNIKRKTEDCFHKVIAARYHLALIQQEISNCPSVKDLKNYSEMVAHKMCNQAELKNDVLVYETEAFLFQTRTNLDILMQLLKYIPEYKYLDDKNKKDTESFIFDNKIKEKNTTAKMRLNNHTGVANFIDDQIVDWIKELNEMRKEIAHRSGLKGFTNFVFDSGSEKVIHPKMPNGEKVDEYCIMIFDKLLALYKKVFQDFILPKLKF